MKIIREDLQKAKNNIKNKIEGYPKIEVVLKNSNTFVVFKKPTERTAKTSSPKNHSTFREL